MATLPSPLWPVRPRPQVGEVLSSWLLRIVDGNGLDQRSFKRYLPKIHGISADLDLRDDEAFFTTITTWSALPRKRIVSLGIAQDEGLVFIRSTTGHPDWIIPRDRPGQWPEKQHVASQPYCPACLASDVTPFYRKVWRYAFHPICPKHGLLAERCLHCGHPFSYLALGSVYWNRYGVHALRRCTACGALFQKPQQGSFEALEQHALAAQSTLMDGLAAGWIEHGSESIPVALFLRGLHVVAEALLSPEYGKTMCAWVAAQHPELVYSETSALIKGTLERQTSVARAWVLVFSFWLVQDWPKRWITLIKKTGIPSSAILPHLKSLPNWMYSEEIEQLRVRKQRRSPEEIAAAKKLLAKLRGYPANNAELTAFMTTGIVPRLKSRLRPISPKIHQAFGRQRLAKTDAVESALKGDASFHRRTKELHPPAQQDNRLNDLLEDMDDTETTLSTLMRQLRNQRGKS